MSAVLILIAAGLAVMTKPMADTQQWGWVAFNTSMVILLCSQAIVLELRKKK